ncbi:transposase [Myxococcus xanthus]|uniref:transposase n=1 Tax=Myxococcus xanthus TaxID=34 RepID=UPI001CECE953|nr:transposase [Myxococcus xanthus]
MASFLRAGSLAASFPTERWTLRRVAHVIQRRYGVHYHRLQAHRSADVQRFLKRHPRAFRAYFLPAYSPDLNPEEQCNASVKKALLNAVPGSLEELRRQARREFRRLQHRPSTLRAYFAHAGLSLNSTG